MPPNPANRRSGEHKMPDGATEDIRVLAATMQLGLQGLNDQLTRHIDEDQRRSDRIDQRLDEGARTMSGISADVKVIISQLNPAAARRSSPPADDTTRAHAALQGRPKNPWWISEIARTIIAVLTTAGVMYLLMHGPAIAKLVTPGTGP